MDARAILKSYIASLFSLGEMELDVLCSDWSEVEYKRKTILTADGEKEDYLNFVLEGIQYAFCGG